MPSLSCRAGALALAVAILSGLEAGPAAAATRLVFACHYTNEQQRQIEAMIAEYERLHPDIDVVYQQVSHRDYLQTVLTARIAGQSPDIYNLHMDWAPRLIAAGALDEPPQALAERVRRDYVPSTVEAATFDGKLWGVPTETSNYLLVYNKENLAEAGFNAPPATWDELLRMSQAMTKRDGSGRATRLGFGYGDTPASLSQPYLSLLFSLGGDVFNAERTASGLASPEAAQALDLYREPARLKAADPAASVVDMPGGNIAMGFVASWRRATYAEVMGQDFTRKVGVAPVPVGGENWTTLQYTFFMGVDANSSAREEAWRFVDWMNAQPAAGKSSPMGDVLANLGGLTGSRPDTAAHPEVYEDPFTKPFVQAMERAKAMAPVAQSEEVKGIIARAVEQAVWGGVESKAALAAAAEEIDAALAGG